MPFVRDMEICNFIFKFQKSYHENQNNTVIICTHSNNSAISSAQIGNMLRNKVGKVVNAGAKTLNKEIDKEIDTAAQKEVDRSKLKLMKIMKLLRLNRVKPVKMLRRKEPSLLRNKPGCLMGGK